MKKAISRQSAEQSRWRKELNPATNGNKSSTRHPSGIAAKTCQPQNDRLHPLCEEKFEVSDISLFLQLICLIMLSVIKDYHVFVINIHSIPYLVDKSKLVTYS